MNAKALPSAAYQIQHGRMFLGALDDSVSRHPWSMVEPTTQSLTNTLIYHVLLGPRLCTRVGNVLYNPVYFNALRTGATPLVPLARTGFFQFHSKSETFNEGIELRAQIGTNSTLDWIKQTGWASGSAMFSELDELQSKIGTTGVLQYDASFAPLFRSLADRVYQEAGPEFQQIYDIWCTRPDGKDKSRSEFELLCEQVFGLKDPRTAAAMSPINSVNHYAYALAMRKLDSNGAEVPLVETKELVSFNAITDAVTGNENRRLNAEQLEELLASKVLDVVRRNLQVPVDLFGEAENWEKLAKFSALDASQDSDFITLKGRVLDEVFKLIDPRHSASAAELEKACKAYSRFLCVELGKPSSKLAEISMNLGLDRYVDSSTTAVAADILTAAAGFAAGAAYGPETAAAAGTAGSFARKGGGYVADQLLNVTLDVNSEDLKYQVRRQFDRFSAPKSSIQEYEEHTKPITSALAIKGMSKEVRSADTNEQIVEMLDRSTPDLF